MTYELKEINYAVTHDPKGFILESEQRYHTQIEQAAHKLLEQMKQRPILFINGPSSSSKTTTASLLGKTLAQHGVQAEVISMDDYYRTRTEYVVPKDEEGVDDLESPICMDLPLLNDHLQRLAAGQEIAVPSFDFVSQSRTTQVRPVRLTAGKIAVIEGIHSLSDTITGGLEERSVGLYLSVDSQVKFSENEQITAPELRFMRRAVRDQKFRAAAVSVTLRQWRSVRRGEQLYITPFRRRASLQIDSYLPYETNILAPILRQELQGKQELLAAAGLPDILHATERFVPFDYQQYLPADTLLHEFIG